MEKNGDALIDVHVVPNAAKTQPMGLHGEAGHLALRHRLHAPPVDGKANQALVEWLAACLEVPPSAIALVHEETSKRRQPRLSAQAAAQAAWNVLLMTAHPPEK